MSTALFDSTEVFGSTTIGKTQGKTGQGGSAADFVPGTAAGGDLKGGAGQGRSAADFPPRGHQLEKEAKAHVVLALGCQINKEAGAHDVRGSDVESDEDSAPPTWVVEADQRRSRPRVDRRGRRLRGLATGPLGNPPIRTQSSPTEHLNGRTWWS